jgi:hypothetical protein
MAKPFYVLVLIFFKERRRFAPSLIFWNRYIQVNPMGNFIGWLGALLLIFLAGFGLTQWLNLPFGNFIDWAIGASILCG